MNAKRAALLVLLILALALTLVWLLAQRGAGNYSVSGTIETDEVRVASRYGGRVEKIAPQEGDTLKPGEVIVELDAAELRARRDQAAATLREMENGPRPAEIAAASNDWQSLVAQLQFAHAEDKRISELFGQKVVSTSERDQAAKNAHTLEQSVAAAKQRYELLQEGTRPERIEQARAQLAEIDAQLDEMRIVAPGAGETAPALSPVEGSPGSAPGENPAPSTMDRGVAVPPGYVLEVLSVKVGDVLAPNREVATLLPTDHLWVRVYVPETWLGLIKLGQTARVRVDSFPGRDFTGTVEQINREAEFTPRNVQTVEDRIRQVFGVKLRLLNEAGALRPGMSADVSFPDVPKPPK